MTIEGTFHEIPRAASRQVLSSSYERNRKLSASMHSSRYPGIRVFLHDREDIRKEYCARERKSSVIFTRVLDSGSWLSLTLNELVVSDLTSRRGCFATSRFHFDTLHSCRPLESSCPSL